MDLLVRLAIVAMAVIISAIVSFFMVQKLEDHADKKIEECEKRLDRQGDAHHSWMYVEYQQQTSRFQEKISSLEKHVFELLARVKQLETPPEIKAQDAAQSAVDEFLKAPW